MMSASPPLAPFQQKALETLLKHATPGRLIALAGNQSVGKTSILEAARQRLGGVRLGARDIQEAVAHRHPLAIEDALFALIGESLARNAFVFVDDLHLVMQVVEGCHAYPRANFVGIALSALASQAIASGHTLIVSTWWMNEALTRLGVHVPIGEPDAADYRAICSVYLSPTHVESLDFAKIHRFARKMNARQLEYVSKAVASKLESAHATNGDATDVFIEHLRLAQLVSNVDLGEVQTVKLQDLKGLDDVLRALEANIIMPLEHSELATELSLKPKRGILLAGPPGTGKTTIGRALAHRLRGKFFLIDGTVIAGTPNFYSQLHHIFDAATRNAPSVVFIDDSDVIFEGQDPGLYRYLLTMLDGLESESVGSVCIVLTAMDVGSMPPALVRSGRIELWLQTTLPDAAARAAILRDLCAKLPAAMGEVDFDQLAEETEGLSGADLKRVVEDGKLLYAFDRARNVATRTAGEYFRDAVVTVQSNKARYAEAEAAARARQPIRPPHFSVPFAGMNFAVAEMAEALGAQMHAIDMTPE